MRALSEENPDVSQDLKSVLASHWENVLLIWLWLFSPMVKESMLVICALAFPLHTDRQLFLNTYLSDLDKALCMTVASAEILIVPGKACAHRVSYSGSRHE